MPSSHNCAYAAVLLLIGCSTSPASRDAIAGNNAATQIRTVRAHFNTAIAEHDTAAIWAIFLPEYHIVTGKNVQGHGGAEELKHWNALFADKTLVYVRRTREVRVNEGWGIAEELGGWSGQFTATDGPVSTSGSYAAKWQRDTSGHWRLLAEVFTTLACNGGPIGCSPPQQAAP
ncbi:MAG TPA: hypothetical protein VGI90_05335 [Steroidobacteraceae bacterium]